MLSIDHSKKMIMDLGKLVGDGVQIVKHGVGLGSIYQIFQVIADVKELIMEAPHALPELRDIDSQEAGELASAAYEMVKHIIQEIGK